VRAKLAKALARVHGRDRRAKRAITRNRHLPECRRAVAAVLKADRLRIAALRKRGDRGKKPAGGAS
jgi:hypothetical protein